MPTRPPFVLLLTLAACTAPNAAPIEGRVAQGRLTDGEGSQARLAGEGTLAAATMVESYVLEADGSLTAQATAEVATDGSYTVSIPEGEAFFVVAALDADGATLGSVVLEPSDAPDTVAVTPMSTETSVEAAVFLDVGADASVWSHIRGRIDAATAAAVEADAEADALLSDLAVATVASAEAEAESWSRSGLDTSAIVATQLEASAALSTDLAAEGTSAYSTFLVALETAAEEQGATAEERAEAEANASMAFRATLDARGSTELLDASASAVAGAEARAYAASTTSLLASAGASQDVLDAAADATVQLEADLATVVTAEMAAEAAEEWRATVIGSAAVEGSLLGDAVGADVLAETTLDAAIDVAVEASAALDASLQVSAQAAVSAPSFDVEAFATGVVDAMEAHRAATRAQVEATLLGLAEPAATAEVIVSVDSAFRAF